MNRLLAGLLGRIYCDEAGEDGGAGGSAGGAGAAVVDKGTAADAGAAGGGAGGADDGKGGTPAAGDKKPAAAAGAAGDDEGVIATARRAAGLATPAAVPEKFIVKDAAGTIDHAATALKIAASNAELEKRMGAAGGAPPAKADDYKLELAEGETELPKVDPAINAKFRAKALVMGLNQKQYNEMTRAGNEIISEILGTAGTVTRTQARTELVNHYGGVAQYEKAAGRAFEAFAAFADEADMAAIDSIGDNPVFIRVFDRIRAELGEDKIPNFNPEAAANENAEIDRLHKDPKSEYRDPTHPGHEAAVRKVTAWHEKQVAMKNRKLA